MSVLNIHTIHSVYTLLVSLVSPCSLQLPFSAITSTVVSNISDGAAAGTLEGVGTASEGRGKEEDEGYGTGEGETT